jgi:cytochrome P450
MFVAESMRLYPSAWIMVRIAENADALPSGATIEAGAKVYVSQFVVHRDSRWFSAPEVFDPRRFEPTVRRRPKHAYIPFGSGPRVCIGEGLARLEAVIVLACIAQRVKLVPLSSKPARLDPSLSLRPRGSLWMRVSPRQATASERLRNGRT